MSAVSLTILCLLISSHLGRTPSILESVHLSPVSFPRHSWCGGESGPVKSMPGMTKCLRGGSVVHKAVPSSMYSLVASEKLKLSAPLLPFMDVFRRR